MDMRRFINITNGEIKAPVREALNPSIAEPMWKKHLNGGVEIASYIKSLDPTVDADAIAERFFGSVGTLTVVDIDKLHDGPDAHADYDTAKQSSYDKLDLIYMPPIIVEKGEVLDGHHRWRAAKKRGATHIQAYSISDGLNESVVIQLGSNKPNPRVQLAYDEFVENSEENPFNPRVRIFQNSKIELKAYKNCLHLSDIQAMFPRKGGGTAAMKYLCDLADKYHVKIELLAKSYTDDHMSTRQLKSWYERFGFEEDNNHDPDEYYGNDDDGWDMVRHPKV